MEKRLKLAKNLLKKDGVLICAIDENELWRLGCLLEEIFFDYEVHLIKIIHNPKGVQGKNFSNTNEFAFFVLPNGQKSLEIETGLKRDLRKLDEKLANATKKTYVVVPSAEEKERYEKIANAIVIVMPFVVEPLYGKVG
jgi:adenine specific DNA methylase Mod